MEFVYKVIEGLIELVFRLLFMVKEGKVVWLFIKRGWERVCLMMRLGFVLVIFIEVVVFFCIVFE